MDKLNSLTEKINELIHLIFEHARVYQETTRDLGLENQETAARLAFQTAYETVLVQFLREENMGQGPINDLILNFIKAIIWQGLLAEKANDGDNVEQPAAGRVR